MTTNPLPTPRAVIFDWDNTLVDTWPIIHAALNATFRAHNMQEWTLDDVRARVSKSMRDSFPEIFGPDWQKAGAMYQAEYRARHLAIAPLPKAETLLDGVRARGLECFVVSNKKGPNLRQEVQHLNWGHYFDAVIGADDAARDKPHPDPVHLVLENSDVIPGPDVWFIGDSEIDLATAEATGCTGILYGDHAAAHPTYSNTHYHGYPFHAHARKHDDTIMLLQGAFHP